MLRRGMISIRLLVPAATTAGVCAVLLCAGREPASPRAAKGPPVDLGPVEGFVENIGQWTDAAAFAATAAGEWVHVCRDGLQVGRGHAAFAIAPARRPATAPYGVAPTATVCNFLLGSDPAAHRTGARVFRAVTQPEVAPGVDLLVRRAAPASDAAFAYDLHLQQQSRVEDIEFRVIGADGLFVDDATGALVMSSPHGELRQSAPVAWVEATGGQRAPVPCRFVLRGDDRFGFVADTGSGPAELCIDPDLVWMTCFGGSSRDHGYAVGSADNGDVFLAGTTESTDLPASLFVFDPTYNGSWPAPWVIGDGYVARLHGADGGLLWCTYLGGSENDRLVGIGAAGGEPIVSGWTTSTDYPTTPGAYDTTHNGTGAGYVNSGGDVYATRVAADGQSLVWSTFLGGVDLEYPGAMAVSQSGAVALSGHVHSDDFPTTPGAWSATRSSHSDLFVSVLAADGASLLASTYWGGTDGEEYSTSMTFTQGGDLIVAGGTDSTDLPVTPNAYDPTFNGGTDHRADGFVVRLTGDLSTVVWCTYLGTPDNEYPRGLALHGDESMTLTGVIDGPGLPTTPASFDPSPSGGLDGFAWHLSADGTSSSWATYVGGSDEDRLEHAVALGGGRTAVTGRTRSADMPLTAGSVGPAPIGNQDGVLLVIAGDGSSVDYGAAIGGPYGDFGYDIARTPAFTIVTSGTTYSGLPVTSGGSPYSGGGDAWAVELAALPQGVGRFGAPSGACGRGARVMARSGPFVGAADFALTAGDVPPGSPTLCAVSLLALGSPQPLLGIDLWVDPGAILASPAVAVDPHACAKLPLPIPNDPGFAGLPLAAQFLWIDSCPGSSLGASDAVTIVVQP